MEWFKIIFPLVGVLIGWFLSESGKIISDRRQDRRRLKKLLFFLLELRYHFFKELSLEEDIDRFLGIVKSKMTEDLYLQISEDEIDVFVLRPLIQQLIQKNKYQDGKFEYLSENIDKIITELSEIFPILAYELNGQHDIKERLNKVDNHLRELTSITDHIPFDIKEWINPKLTKSLLDDLDKSIEKISKKLGKKMLNVSKEKILKMNEVDKEEMENFVEEYFSKISNSLNEYNSSHQQ